MPALNVSAPLRRTIGAGPNAGRPRPVNVVLVDQVEGCKQAVLALRNNGYMCIAAHAGVDGRPVVQVAVERRCHEAIGDGEAEYYRRSDTHLHGRFHALLHGVAVVWTERVQP